MVYITLLFLVWHYFLIQVFMPFIPIGALVFVSNFHTVPSVPTRAFPEVWWTFKTFISKLHNLFPSQSIFNLKAPRWAP